MTTPIRERLNRDFKVHRPDADQTLDMHTLRDGARWLAELIVTHVPEGREQSLALTKVEEAMFWANAGIARHG